jgi:hypothetical protein
MFRMSGSWFVLTWIAKPTFTCCWVMICGQVRSVRENEICGSRAAFTVRSLENSFHMETYHALCSRGDSGIFSTYRLGR